MVSSPKVFNIGILEPKRISKYPDGAVRPGAGDLSTKRRGWTGHSEAVSVALHSWSAHAQILLLVGKLRMLERNVGDPYHPYFFVRAVPHATRTSNLVLPLRQFLSADRSTTKRTS